MDEVLGAIIGALLGAFLTWILTRKQPQRIICEETFRSSFEFGHPDMQILYQDTPVQRIAMARLRFRNMGPRVIENPKLTVKLNEDAQILSLKEKIVPERGTADFLETKQIQEQGGAYSQQSSIGLFMENNWFQVLIDRFAPYSLNQETVTIDIFSEGEIKEIDVLGSGILGDGIGWSVDFQPRKFTSWTQRMTTFSLVNFYALILSIIAYMILRFPYDIFSVNAVNRLFRDPLLWTVLAWGLLTLLWAFYWGLQGVYVSLPVIPFLGPYLRLSLEKRKIK